MFFDRTLCYAERRRYLLVGHALYAAHPEYAGRLCRQTVAQRQNLFYHDCRHARLIRRIDEIAHGQILPDSVLFDGFEIYRVEYYLFAPEVVVALVMRHREDVRHDLVPHKERAAFQKLVEYLLDYVVGILPPPSDPGLFHLHTGINGDIAE